MSSSDYATDGALGTSSMGLNPFTTPGLIRAIATGTDISANVVGNIIASAEDSQPNTVSSYNKILVDDAGNYYTYNGAGLTLQATATTNAAFYTSTKVDAVSYVGKIYVSTANGDIDVFTTASLSLANAWWTSAPQSKTSMSSYVPHPMIVYQGNLYVADRNHLHTIDQSANIALNVLSLGVTGSADGNENIYALAIDPGTGLMMISVQTTINISDTLSSRFYVYLYDGISSKPTRKIEVDDLVTAFYHLEGQVYIGAGQTLGLWNGNGVTFLRKLQNVSLINTDLPYKQHFASTRSILHVVDGATVLSYGAAISGKKGFFYTATNPSGGGHLSALVSLGSNKLGIAYATNKISSFDFSSTAAGTATLYFNNIYFPRPIYVRRMRLITTGITTTAGIGGTAIIDEFGTVNQSAVSTFVVLAADTPEMVFDFDFSSLKLQAIQPKITFDTQGFGLVRVYIYYDISE
jgi:hypothetical protein